MFASGSRTYPCKMLQGWAQTDANPVGTGRNVCRARCVLFASRNRSLLGLRPEWIVSEGWSPPSFSAGDSCWRGFLLRGLAARADKQFIMKNSNSNAYNDNRIITIHIYIYMILLAGSAARLDTFVPVCRYAASFGIVDGRQEAPEV